MERVDPVFGERKFNAVPVRMIIDKQGKVKHIHFLSAFPDQVKAITDALFQWRFRPCLRDGKPCGSRKPASCSDWPHARPPPPPSQAVNEIDRSSVRFVKEFLPPADALGGRPTRVFFNCSTGGEQHHRHGPQSEPRETGCRPMR